MQLGLRKPNFAVVFVAALILFAQSFLSGWSTGAMAGTPMLDAFGNPLCITSTDQGGAPAGDHSKLPNCCTFGCSTVSPVLAAPDFDSTSLVRRLVISSVLFAIGQDLVIPSPDHDSGSPRAPPLTA